LVLDADALNMLAQETNGWQKIPPGTILTPHPGEFSRLFGDEAFPSSLNQPEQSTIPPSSFTGRPNSWLRLEKQRHLSQTLGVVIVLKGANTLVTLPDGNAVFNPTGNPGMATGGSGDVLTGIITGLLAQGFTPAHAAISGVYLHGLAGDLAARKITQPALIASDIVDSLGRAFREIFDFRQP
jgi:NAD(P)H-hydrate epimerase